LEAAGKTATTNPGGAEKWRDEYAEPLRDATVIIVADKDEPGRNHAAQVRASLERVGATVYVVEAAEGKDAHDHLTAGRSVSEFVSSTTPLRGGSVARSNSQPRKLNFRPLEEALANIPTEPPWIWEGYLAPSTLALLAGRPKVGKSTFLFALLQAIKGEESSFLGFSLNGGAALLLSEERQHTLKGKAEFFFSPQDTLYIEREETKLSRVHTLMQHEAEGMPWPETIRQAADYCHENGLGLLIVDTLPQWTLEHGYDENDSQAVLEQIRPLQVAAAEGLAVFLVAHQRKSQGEFGEAVRGSGALVGAVDVVLELERVSGGNPNLRALRSVSRFASTPDELIIELTENGYEARGDSQEAMARDEAERIIAHLHRSGELAADKLAEALDIPRSTTSKRLSQLRDEGRVSRTGEGTRGNPFLWSASAELDLATAPMDALRDFYGAIE
jgi:DNA-binding transcriptional ArsR family regulator